VRRAKRAATRATSLEVVRQLEALANSHMRTQLGPMAAAAAMDAIGRVTSGEVKLRGADVAGWVRALVDVARMEAGEPTSAALIAHVSTADVAARVEQLQVQARAALAIAPTVDDQADRRPLSLAAEAARYPGADLDGLAAVHALKPDGAPEG
jgi:hypothetical protein